MSKTLLQRIATDKLIKQAAQDLQGKPCVMCLTPSRVVARGEKDIDLPDGKKEFVSVIIPVCVECIKASTIVTRRICNEIAIAEAEIQRDKSKQRQN